MAHGTGAETGLVITAVDAMGNKFQLKSIAIVDADGSPYNLLTEDTGQQIVRLLTRLVELSAKQAGDLP